MNCDIEGCDAEAAFELHIPWRSNRPVCAAHARTEARQDGVVADALSTAEDELPDGATGN